MMTILSALKSMNLKLKLCNNNQHYKDTVKDFFDTVYAKKLTTVAVDLRDNPGGDSSTVHEFIHYLDVKDYRSCTVKVKNRFVLFRKLFDCFFIGHQVENTVIPAKADHPFSGNVYVLTSTKTFSSAMEFSQYIQDNGIGKVIGEIPGNMPLSYGDISVFKLPNSGIYLHVPYILYHRIDMSKEDIPLIPDIECDADDALDKLKSILE